MSYVAPSSPLSIGGVLDNWIRLFRASYSRCWTLALVAAAATAAVQFAITPVLPLAHETPLQYLQGMFSVARMASLLLVLSWLITLVVDGALFAQQLAIMRGGTPLSFSRALGTGLRRLPQILLAGVLILMIIAAVCVPIGAGVALLISLHRAGHDPRLLLLLISIGLLALWLLLVYLFVRLEFWLPAIFAEDCGGAASLGHSWRLVRGHWWRVTMITFVAVIVISILKIAINLVAAGIGGLFGLQAPAALADPAKLIHRIHIVSAIATAGNIVIVPLFTAMWLSIYHDLKLRRGGADLAARAEALGG